MNAYLLHMPDGTPTDVSACGPCGLTVRDDFELSQKCCSCYECGKPKGAEHWSVHCHDCSKKVTVRHRARQVEEAELVAEYEGPIFCYDVKGGSCGEDYFQDLEELQQCLDFHEGQRPQFAFACTVREGIGLDLGSILESACDDLYEDAVDDLNGVDGLTVAVDAFNQANKSLRCYDVDFKRKIAIPA